MSGAEKHTRSYGTAWLFFSYTDANKSVPDYSKKKLVTTCSKHVLENAICSLSSKPRLNIRDAIWQIIVWLIRAVHRKRFQLIRGNRMVHCTISLFFPKSYNILLQMFSAWFSSARHRKITHANAPSRGIVCCILFYSTIHIHLFARSLSFL